MSFWKGVFSEPNGSPSASRVMMAFHAICGAAWGSAVVYHTHAIPDVTTMAGVTAFVTAPYAINQIKNAVNQNPAPPGP